MARPTRQGVDYFPLDVHLDDKFKFIEIKYKLEGFALLIKLLQRVYDHGYWCKWGEDEACLFANENRVDVELVNNVITECAKRDIMSASCLHQYGILTSIGIQKRYVEMVKRRKDVEVIKEYKVIADIFGVNEVINGVNDNIMYTSCQHDDSKSTQSKVDKSRVDKNIVEHKPNTSSKSKKKNIFDDIHLELANLLLKEIKNNNPNFKEPNIESWANTVRLMMNQDNRSYEDIKEVITWCQHNSFWYKNILSANKLRDKFDTLKMQMEDKKGVNKNEKHDSPHWITSDLSKIDFTKNREVSWMPDED